MSIERQKLRACQIVIEIGRLGQKSKPRLSVRIANVFAEQPGFPACGIDQAHQDLQGRGLARPIRAQESKDFSLSNFKIEFFQRRHLTAPEAHLESLSETFGL